VKRRAAQGRRKSRVRRAGSTNFGAVFSNDVLCHVPERLKVFGEMFRVLKLDGRDAVQ
jgi:ubiquinone/menaquinone biosynthesis C-methylase UbiE